MALSLPRGPRGLGTSIGDQDLVPQFFEQVAGPPGVGPYLHGYATGREDGELPMEGSSGRGQAGLFDQISILVEDCEVRVLVSQVQPQKSRAIV